MKRLTALFVILFLGVAIFYHDHSVQSRIDEARSDITQYQSEANKDSIGIRLQLYETAWTLFMEDPWLGKGNRRVNFRNAIMKKADTLSPGALKSLHFHNELLQRLFQYGIFGGIAWFAVLFIPLIYFFRYVRSNDTTLRSVAFMGIVFNSGIFFSGLSDLMLEGKSMIQYYVVIQSILCALLIRRQSELVKDSCPGTNH